MTRTLYRQSRRDAHLRTVSLVVNAALGAALWMLAALVFCSPQHVDFSVINGRLVVEGGHVLTVDLGPVIERQNRISRELVSA